MGLSRVSHRSDADRDRIAGSTEQGRAVVHDRPGDGGALGVAAGSAGRHRGHRPADGSGETANAFFPRASVDRRDLQWAS